MGEQGRWQLAEGLFAELEREQLGLMAREAQLAAAQQLTAGLASGAPGAGAGAGADADAVQHASGSSTCSQLGGGGSEASFELSAFPGMRKTVALDLPTAAAAGGAPQADAVAAAAAAVAAVAAAHQQQALVGGAEAGGAGLLQQLLLQSSAASTAATAAGEDAACAAAPPTGPAFSYFSSLFAAPAAVEPAACATSKASSAPSSPDSVAAAAAAWALPAGAGGAAAGAVPSDTGAAWTNDNAAVRGLSLSLADLSAADAALAPWAAATPAAPAAAAPALRPLPKGKGPVNEVVCGALMLAFERAGKAAECAAVLDRARALGESPVGWPPAPLPDLPVALAARRTACAAAAPLSLAR